RASGQRLSRSCNASARRSSSSLPGSSSRGVTSACREGGELALDAGDVGLGAGEPDADLVDDRVGRLGDEGVVAELGGRELHLLAGGGEVLVEALAFGGDVDGAR